MGTVRQAIQRTQDFLLAQQHSEGYWVAELESDASVSAGYIPLMRFMGVEDPRRERKVVHFLRQKQLADGGWDSYPGGEGSLDVSVQVYFALKLAGIPAGEPSMQRAREFILAQGGVEGTHTFTKLMLAPFGQFDWARLPTLPPELMLLPNWFPMTIYDFASWARETIVALLVLMARRPVYPLTEEEGIGELYRGAAVPPTKKAHGLVSWKRFFLGLDRLLKVWERVPWKPGRERALRKAERWIVEHQEADGSWGGIMLPWVYSLFALKSRGYADEHPVIARGLAGLEDFIVEDADTLRLQPAVSPVWDTALTLIALRDSGLPPDHPALVRAARWLMGKQVLTGGDWQVKNPHTEPGGWAFEFENDFYPDVDDSVVVPLALRLVHLPEEAEEKAKTQAIERAVRWVLSMQCRDGGWAAFDVDNDKEVLAHIPFADFMTPLDPTSVDVTAHVVELLGKLGYPRDHSALSRALRYVWENQEEDGAWFGRWGVNYVYGTAAVLPALRQVGEEIEQARIRQAVGWLVRHQNEDGGWGESCRSYKEPSQRGIGPSTASQTAWALLALLAVGEEENPAVVRGIEYLLRMQRDDGRWDEETFTGTGFPRAFYLRYHFYPLYFPLMALGRFERVVSDQKPWGRPLAGPHLRKAGYERGG